MGEQTAIRLNNICKQYRVGFWGRKITVLDNLNLEVRRGEIFGYLGANGSGKTTTFKVMLDLIRPDSGEIYYFGRKAGIVSRRQVGFLPENPYFYMYLTAFESLNFYGRLKGMNGKERKKKIEYLLKLVDLQHACKRSLRKFSRGMLQRLGIAQAMINDPEIMILDEPMSGLDPIGRKQMRDIILSCREQGKTIIFSSHILSDVEILCDRAAIIRKGKLQGVFNVGEMLDDKIESWEITCTNLVDENMVAEYIVHRSGNRTLLRVNDEQKAKRIIFMLEDRGIRVISFVPHRESLEDYFRNRSHK